MTPLLYLDQNYLSGIAKRKPAFTELEGVLRAAIAAGAVRVPESAAHRLESAPRPDLALLDLLRELSGGLLLPDDPAPEVRLRLAGVLAREFPGRAPRASDAVDVVALATAMPRCRLVTCDAHMAEVCRRTRLDLRFGCELYTGRRPDVRRLARRLRTISG